MLQEDNVGNGAPADDLFGLEQTRFREGVSAYLGKYASRPAPDREVQLR
jgi:hypothetical protein